MALNRYGYGHDIMAWLKPYYVTRILYDDLNHIWSSKLEFLSIDHRTKFIQMKIVQASQYQIFDAMKSISKTDIYVYVFYAYIYIHILRKFVKNIYIFFLSFRGKKMLSSILFRSIFYVSYLLCFSIAIIKATPINKRQSVNETKPCPFDTIIVS